MGSREWGERGHNCICPSGTDGRTYVSVSHADKCTLEPSNQAASQYATQKTDLLLTPYYSLAEGASRLDLCNRIAADHKRTLITIVDFGFGGDAHQAVDGGR